MLHRNNGWQIRDAGDRKERRQDAFLWDAIFEAA